MPIEHSSKSYYNLSLVSTIQYSWIIRFTIQLIFFFKIAIKLIIEVAPFILQISMVKI